jgi:hypothetical protein
MLPLIDDEPASGDTKPAAKQRYHAIRKCDSLKAPSIFLHWDDCSFYVDEEENDVQVEYQSFDLISEAVKYIQRSDEASEATKLPATTTPKQHHSETLGSSKSGTKDRAARVAPVARASSLLSPTKRSAEEALLSSPGGKKRKVSSSSTTKPAPVAFMSKANGERVPLYAEADVVDLLDDGGDDSFGGGDDDDDDFNFESSTTKPAPASSRAYSRESGILQEKFDTKFELLKEYKQVHGTCNVSFKTGVGKFQGLCNFVQFWKLRLKALEQEPNHPELVDDPNILRLTELGLEAPGTGRKAQWEQSFNLLAEYKELHGTCVVPTNLDPFNKFHSLHRWIYFQHIEMRNYEEDPATSKFDESRYTRLVNLGLAVKGRMQENFDKKFELLKEYKKVYGTCNVAFKRSVGRFHGLHHFVQSWRLKLKALEQEPNNPELVDDPNILRLTILGLEAPCAGRKAIWEQSFTLLAEYKEIHGTCVVPTNLEPSSKFNSIHRWIYLQRTDMRSYEEDPATSKLDESRYMRLANLGLEKGNERKAAKFNVTLPWEDMFEELKKFAKDNGHVKVPKRPITVLQNWVQLMHTHYDRMKQGKKSQLTVQRIAQMVALGFAFDVKVDRMVFDDRALQWLEYKTKHGCDPTTTSGDGLGEWIRYVFQEIPCLAVLFPPRI